MGLFQSRQVEVFYRDGMMAEMANIKIPTNKSINEIQLNENQTIYSRVGIMSEHNFKQTRNWYWITDRTLSLSHYIRTADIPKNHLVTLCFFK